MEGVWDLENLRDNSLITNPLEEMCKEYFTRLQNSMINLDMNASSPLKFTVTSMHGVSHLFMVDAFKYCKFSVSKNNIYY